MKIREVNNSCVKGAEIVCILVVYLYAVTVEIFRNDNLERLNLYSKKEIVNWNSRI